MNVDASAVTPPLAGVLPVVQLPYHEDESIDFATLEREIDWLFAHGVAGVAMAMVTETLRLTTDERKRVAAAICQATSTRGASVISVGAESTFAAVEYAKHAESVGATAVMAIAPISVPPLTDELIRYFERLATAVSIPLVVQDASGYVGQSLGLDDMKRLLNAFGPERILFKPEASPVGPKLTALHEATDHTARVFEGSGGIALVDNYRRGIAGTMPGSDLIVGIMAIWNALVQGDESSAYRVSLPLSSLVSLQIGLDGFLAVEKHLLVKQGVFRNAVVRGPVGFRLDAETRNEVERLFTLMLEAVESVL